MASAMKWLAFAICVAGLVWGPFARTFEDVRRYGYMADIMPSDWRATNIWLDSTECTVSRGVWLAVCENGKLIPISERAIADDPGHALLLNAWAGLNGKRATLVDVARLSTLLNTIGLVALAALLFQPGRLQSERGEYVVPPLDANQAPQGNHHRQRLVSRAQFDVAPAGNAVITAGGGCEHGTIAGGCDGIVDANRFVPCQAAGAHLIAAVGARTQGFMLIHARPLHISQPTTIATAAMPAHFVPGTR